MTTVVVLYSHRGCAGGEAAQRYLEQHGIPYRLRDVLAEQQAREEFRQLGGIGTPLLQVGTRLMHGFDPDELEELMRVAEGRPDHG